MRNLSWVLVIGFLTSCRVAVAPVRVDSDPKQESRAKTQDKVEADAIEAFITEHPDMDEQMKQDLRDGTISRHVALERLNQRK